MSEPIHIPPAFVGAPPDGFEPVPAPTLPDTPAAAVPEAPSAPVSDPVTSPAHYTKGSIEPIDFIDAWDFDFFTGNVIKYVVRAPFKGKKLEDLKKARFYLDRLIAKAEKAS